jgi:hypothetical protein
MLSSSSSSSSSSSENVSETEIRKSAIQTHGLAIPDTSRPRCRSAPLLLRCPAGGPP